LKLYFTVDLLNNLLSGGCLNFSYAIAISNLTSGKTPSSDVHINSTSVRPDTVGTQICCPSRIWQDTIRLCYGSAASWPALTLCSSVYHLQTVLDNMQSTEW